MEAIQTIEQAKKAFPDLKWRDQPSDNGKERVAFVIVGGKLQGEKDIVILLALEGGAGAYLHRHDRGETITSFVGMLRGISDDPEATLLPGKTIDIYRLGASTLPSWRTTASGLACTGNQTDTPRSSRRVSARSIRSRLREKRWREQNTPSSIYEIVRRGVG